GVLQGLALVDRRSAGLEREGVGRQPLRGELERRRRARRRLEEHVHDESPSQRRQLFVVALLGEREGVRGRDQAVDVVARQVCDGEQVAATPRLRRQQVQG